MKKRTSKILIGVLIVAGLILALPFSSFRESFNSNTNSFSDNVLANITNIDNTKNKEIASSVSKSLRSVELQGLYDNISTQNKSKAQNNRINNKPVTDKFILSGIDNKTISNSQIANISSGLPVTTGSNNNEMVNNPGEGVVNLNNSSSNGKNTNTQVNTGTNYIAMSTDLTTPAAATKETTKQLAGGGPPPGEIEPAPPSLPIGDGYYFMFILGIVFTVFKIRKIAFE